MHFCLRIPCSKIVHIFVNLWSKITKKCTRKLRNSVSIYNFDYDTNTNTIICT